MLDRGSGNEVFHSCDDVRKSHIMTSLLLYRTRRVASLVSWFVIQVRSGEKKVVDAILNDFLLPFINHCPIQKIFKSIKVYTFKIYQSFFPLNQFMKNNI